MLLDQNALPGAAIPDLSRDLLFDRLLHEESDEYSLPEDIENPSLVEASW
jgi:hypothetical protein